MELQLNVNNGSFFGLKKEGVWGRLTHKSILRVFAAFKPYTGKVYL